MQQITAFVTGYNKGDHIAFFFMNFHFKMLITYKRSTDFNFGVMILISFCYTHKESSATPTSGLGRVSTRVDGV